MNGKDFIMSDILLTETQVAELLQIKPATLKRWRWSRVGPTFCKIGGSVRYKRSELEKFIADSTHAAQVVSN